MGHCACCRLFIWLSIFSLVKSYGGPTVGIFTQCGDGTGYNKIVPKDNKMRVIIDGSSFWPSDSKYCTAVFRAKDVDDRLYYEVISYTMYSKVSEIKFETKSEGSSYRELERYSFGLSDPYYRKSQKSAETYIRITVTREWTNNKHFYMSLDLYTHDYWSDHNSIVKLTVGAIIGIVATVVAVLVIIIIICVCCVCKAGKRRSHKDVMVTTDTRNAHIDIPEIGPPSAYPYSPPAENFVCQPGYQTGYLPQPYGQQPPSYGQQPPPYTDTVPIKPSAPSY